jgi:hypothetical protein
MSILTRVPAGARPVVWGLLIGVFGLGLLAVLIVLQTAFSYDGNCGGLLPFTGEAGECTMWEYLRLWLPFNFEVVVYSYWPFLTAILFAPPVILESYYAYLKRRGVGGTRR